MQGLRTHTIQIFEYQTIRIGEVINGYEFDEAKFKALAIYQEKHSTKYYSLVYNGIKFSHYVGIIQVGRLTIEILPKADKTNNNDYNKWQKILLEMVQYCRLLKIEPFGSGNMQLANYSILDLYLKKFIFLINQLVIKGLPKMYLPIENNLKVLKGRLNIPKQLRKNSLHPERFYVHYSAFDYSHLFNQVLFEAIKVLEKIHLKPTLQLKIKQLLALFPKLVPYSTKVRDFDLLFKLKKYKAHHELLEICRMILFNFSPDIKSGQHHLLAFLFDINKLFEEYVFRQLKRLENEQITVLRQTSKPFWQRRTIRPDLLLNIGTKKFILDTKWKILQGNTPSMEDLKQLYIYCQYFGAENGILLYPNIFDFPNAPTIPFQPNELNKAQISSQIMFLNIVDEQGKLNRGLGSQILKQLQINI